MTDTLTIIVSMAGMLVVATGVILTVTVTLFRMVGQRIDDLRDEMREANVQLGKRMDDSREEARAANVQLGKRIDDSREEARAAHAQLGKRIDDSREEARAAHAQLGKQIDGANTRIDDTNQVLSDLRADFRNVLPRATAEHRDQ